MPVNNEFLLYSLAHIFNTTLGIKICDNTKKYIKAKTQSFAELDIDDKMYYTKYAIELAKNLTNYLEDITHFEINTDANINIEHDFRLTWKEKNVAHISMSHYDINLKDVIPKKLMKICQYNGNTNINKFYTTQYKKINDKHYHEIQDKGKYSELDEETKSSIFKSVCDLVVITLTKKRKCAVSLYNYLFEESDRIVLKLYKDRFTIYDFGKELDEVESFGMKFNQENEILVTFNNKTKFNLTLQINSTIIKQNLSLKFHTVFKNMDELFAVGYSTI
jgi:hypothetical protein